MEYMGDLCTTFLIYLQTYNNLSKNELYLRTQDILKDNTK